MRPTALACLVALIALAGVAEIAAQPAPVSRVFAGPLDKVWSAAEATLKSLGWNLDQKNQAIGSIVTDSRSIDFKEFGVYGDGTRHKLRVSVTAAGEGQTSVTVERELYREERILWISNKKAIETSDRSVETAVLDALARVVPAVAAGPPPSPSPSPVPGSPPGASASPIAGVPPVTAPPPGTAPPSVAAAPPGSGRGEFPFKVTYRVKGTAGSAVLTYRNARGGTEQSNARLPWELSFDAKGGLFLYVSAQNEGTSGSVTCEILLDGETRTSSTSSGAYVIAECSNAAERN
jgi:hypothetical protein